MEAASKKTGSAPEAIWTRELGVTIWSVPCREEAFPVPAALVNDAQKPEEGGDTLIIGEIAYLAQNSRRNKQDDSERGEGGPWWMRRDRKMTDRRRRRVWRQTGLQVYSLPQRPDHMPALSGVEVRP